MPDKNQPVEIRPDQPVSVLACSPVHVPGHFSAPCLSHIAEHDAGQYGRMAGMRHRRGLKSQERHNAQGHNQDSHDYYLY
jgi:hypothetical protein